MWLKGIAWNEHLEELLMDGERGQADYLTLQLTVNNRAFGPAGDCKEHPDESH